MISEDPSEFIYRESLESSSPAATTPSSPALRPPELTHFQTSTPVYPGKKLSHSPISLSQVSTSVGPIASPSGTTYGEPTLTPPPRSPGGLPPSAGDGKSQNAPDGTSSDKSSETAVGVPHTPSAPLSRKESYKAQRQHYRKEKKRAASALLHSIEDPSVVVLADWLKVRGSLKSWTKLWCVLKPGLLLLYKSPKAKSSHWVGTVLLTSCQVIERPSKKDGFCFKLYHPLEQSIWAPRGPHNETIGAVVQPLPTAHLIFRAPSQSAGHCWLDGLELALRCSNAMLRCSRAETEAVTEDAPQTQSDISHEELEKHFNEQAATTSTSLLTVKEKTTLDSNLKDIDKKSKSPSMWSQIFDATDRIEIKTEFIDAIKKKDFFKDIFERTSESETKIIKNTSKSALSTPVLKMEKIVPPLLRCLELPKKSFNKKDLLALSDSTEKRRCKTPNSLALPQKRISELRESGAKTDSETDEFCLRGRKKKVVYNQNVRSLVKSVTTPSIRVCAEYSSSSTDDCDYNLKTR